MTTGNPARMADVMGELEQKANSKVFKISRLSEPVTTHITLPRGDYVVDFDIKVEPKGILEIAPGSTLRFGKNHGVRSRGQLIAVGNPENRIIFTSYLETWKNIYMSGPSSKGSLLKYCDISNGTVAESDFPKHAFPVSGGAIYVVDTELTIEDCLIEGNSAERGCGLGALASSCTIRRTIIRNNYPLGGSREGGSGGAISARNGKLMIYSSVISNNTQKNGGAGIEVDHSFASIEDSLIEENTIREVMPPNTAGGGVLLCYSKARISGSTFRSNIAGIGGGLYVFYSQDVILEDTKILGNKARTAGAGIELYRSDIEFRNCSIMFNRVTHSDKSKGDGSGIYAYDCEPRLKSTWVLLNHRNNITHVH
jgi:hypothetical protein